MDEMS